MQASGSVPVCVAQQEELAGFFKENDCERTLIWRKRRNGKLVGGWHGRLGKDEYLLVLDNDMSGCCRGHQKEGETEICLKEEP